MAQTQRGVKIKMQGETTESHKGAKPPGAEDGGQKTDDGDVLCGYMERA